MLGGLKVWFAIHVWVLSHLWIGQPYLAWGTSQTGQPQEIRLHLENCLSGGTQGCRYQ